MARRVQDWWRARVTMRHTRAWIEAIMAQRNNNLEKLQARLAARNLGRHRRAWAAHPGVGATLRGLVSGALLLQGPPALHTLWAAREEERSGVGR